MISRPDHAFDRRPPVTRQCQTDRRAFERRRVVHDLQAARQEVHRRAADEFGDEAVHGGVIHVPRTADLLDPPGVHHGDPLAHHHGFQLIVGDVDRGGAQLLLQADEVALKRLAPAGVQVAQRLVQQQHLRITHHAAPQSDPLPLAPGQLGGAALQQIADPQHFGRLAHAAFDLRPRQAAQLETESQVLEDVQMRIQREMLEDHRHVAVFRGKPRDRAAADADLAGRRLVQTRDQPQRGRLAAARGTDQHQQLAVPDLEIEPVDGRHAAVGFAQLFEDDFGHATSGDVSRF